MAKFSGNSGNVTLSGSSGTWASGVVVNNVMRWNATVDRGLVDSTSKVDAGDKSSIYGSKTARANVVMRADDTTALALTAGSSDPTITLTLTGSRQIRGSAKLETLEYGDVDFVEGETPVITFSFQFQPGFALA